MPLRYLLLMRHAKHAKGKAQPPETPLEKIASSLRELTQSPGPSLRSRLPHLFRRQATPESHQILTAQGLYETQSAAHCLRQSVEEQKLAVASGRVLPIAETLKLAAILHHDSDEATATAEAFRATFDPLVPLKESALLGPATQPVDLDKADGGSTLEKAVVAAANKVAGCGSADAVLFVGHQPAIGWLAAALLGEPVPVVQSEILCIDLNGSRGAELSWCVSPSDDAALAALQDKIKSKMALANVLSGFLTAGIGLVLTLLADYAKIGALGVQAVVVFIAAGCFILAVFLYLRTMFSYDALLMPVRFWAESASGSRKPSWIVARPPSGAASILYHNMLRIWRTQFLRATFLTLSGLLLLWSAVFWSTCRISHSPHPDDTALARVLGLAPLVMAALAVRWITGTKIGNKFVRNLRYRWGPWLGSED